MAPTNRKRINFPRKVKASLALRANHRCSFTDCGIPTSGPSDESPSKALQLGDASHIHGTSPNGPRYLSSLTPGQCADIENGIWLCATHNRLIDGDTAKYTAVDLKKMRLDHEERVTNEILRRSKDAEVFGLISIGPDVVGVGEVKKATDTSWILHIDHFVEGDISTLINYIEKFHSVDEYDKYVLVDALGDGRVLSAPPSWEKSDSGHVITCPIKTSALRIAAHNLSADLVVNADHDIFTTNGNLAMVSGLEALPQKIASCLSIQEGEMWFHPKYGVRLQEYTHLYRESAWLPHFIKLEVIRMASVPYHDPIITSENTPLQCVRRVLNVEVANTQKDGDWTTFHFELDIEGLGNWKCDIPIFLKPAGPQPSR